MIRLSPLDVNLIISGKKTIEIRKSKPKQLETPFKVYIYCIDIERYYLKDKYSKIYYPIDKNEIDVVDQDFVMNGKVVGEFICDKIYQYTTTDFKDGTDIDDETITKLSCLTKDEIKDYEITTGYFGVFGWHISDLMIYDKPKSLQYFTRYCKYNCDNCNDRIIFSKHHRFRPPQGWGYVNLCRRKEFNCINK
jgi:hypothetical protein